MFDGQFSTAYPEGSQASPMRVESQHRSEEPSSRLFAALAAEKTNIVSPPKDRTLIACEIFATADFEASTNSQFILLCTVFEALANRKRPKSITGSLRKLATKASAVLGNPKPKQAGEQAANLYSKRGDLVHEGISVTKSDVADIRKLVRECLAVEAGCYNDIRKPFP